MPTAGHIRSRFSGALLFCAFAAAALAVLAYGGAITDDFSGGDTLALVEESRIRSVEDAGRVFTRPLISIATKFFRPTASLSFALDFAVWGLDARGFHITDVAIHAIVCALIVLVVHRLSRDTLAACLAGVTFALHPIAMEVVPALARRQDMLAALFSLVSLFCLPRGERSATRLWAWIPSLFAYALALGAKEASIVFPGVVFAWAFFIRSNSPRDRSRWRDALRAAAPFAVLVLIFFGWRAWVLSGAGGNERTWTWTTASIPLLFESIADFVADLVYPLRAVFHPYLHTADRVIAVGAAVCLLWAMHSLMRTWSARSDQSRHGSARWVSYFGWVVCGAVLLFPAVSWWIRAALEQAHRGEGWAALAQWMHMRKGQSVDVYVWRAFDFARLVGTTALAVGIVAMLIARRRSQIVKPAAMEGSRFASFMAAWMCLYLLLFLAVQRYHVWYAYEPAIPFCCLVACGVSQGLRGARSIAAICAVLIVWLACYSPLVRGLNAWTDSGRFNSMIMDEVARIAAEAPAGSTLEFHEFPNLNASPQPNGPRPTTAYTINKPSLKAWLRLVQPQKGLKVELRSNVSLQEPFSSIRLDWEAQPANTVAVRATILSLHSGFQSIPLVVDSTEIQLIEPPRDTDRAVPSTSLRVIPDAYDVRAAIIPMTHVEVGSIPRTVYAQYSDPRGDTRSITCILKENAISVQVEFNTDYGSFGGVVDRTTSSAYVRDGRLCFELSIKWTDGPGTERWIGEVGLP